MYYPIEGGSSVTIQALECQLPPVGYIRDWKTGRLKNIGVYQRHKRNNDECFWEIDSRFQLYKQWRSQEKSLGKKSDQLEDFIEDCFLYRRGGFWFSNNGEPTYITGTHWYYLSVFNIDIGLPKYRDVDREFFYCWAREVEDPCSYGLTYLTKRRNGKSYQSACIGVELATRIEMFNVGIQSKTETDAKKLFRKAVSSPYKQLPYFFQPSKTKSSSTGKISDKEIRFVSGKDGDSDDELGGYIDYRSNGEGDYDGEKLGYYFADEVGKKQDCDINERWRTVRKCLTDFTGEILGKTIHTTTVEDMGGRCGKSYKQMWDQSNQEERQNNGRTKSGLSRFFVSGDRVRHLDKFGKANIELALIDIMGERDAEKGNPRALAKVIRQDPLNTREPFLSDGDQCPFNSMLLNGREQEIDPAYSSHLNLYRRGNFKPKDIDNPWAGVDFIENPNGLVYMIEEPPEEIRNRITFRMQYQCPGNSHLYSMGVDTYDHRIVMNKENERDLSDGSWSILKKPSDTYSTEMDNGLVCYFRKRLEDPIQFYKQTIMAMIYFGVEALIERNKPGLLNYMTQQSLELYATLLPGQTQRGIHTSDVTNNNIFELTDHYINEHCGKINIIDLIDDWKNFDQSNTTAFDGAMGFGLALIQWDKKKPKQNSAKENRPSEVKDYLSMYNKGNKPIFAKAGLKNSSPYWWE